MQQQPQQQQIPLQATPEILKGVYTNNMYVSHSKDEFVLDFMNLTNFPQAASLVGKIITSPGHFKRMVAAFNDNLNKYEEVFGKIEAQKPEQKNIDSGKSDSSKFGFK
jgi:hypothetical protein